MARWFRMYNEVLDDPKVQKLSPALFKAWVNLLCLAARHDGTLPLAVDIAFALRMSDAAVTATLDELVGAGLLDHDETGIRPHNWRSRQHVSDVSTERVNRFRQRKRNGDETVSVTPPETEADTESESEKKGKKTMAPNLRASRACQTSTPEGKRARWRQKVTEFAKGSLAPGDFVIWLAAVADGDHEALERMNDAMRLAESNAVLKGDHPAFMKRGAVA